MTGPSSRMLETFVPPFDATAVARPLILARRITVDGQVIASSRTHGEDDRGEAFSARSRRTGWSGLRALYRGGECRFAATWGQTAGDGVAGPDPFPESSESWNG
jgi:hypothetical protein